MYDNGYREHLIAHTVKQVIICKQTSSVGRYCINKLAERFPEESMKN